MILEIRGFYRFRIQDTAVDTVARIFAATSIAAMSLTFVRAVLADDTTSPARRCACGGSRCCSSAPAG